MNKMYSCIFAGIAIFLVAACVYLYSVKAGQEDLLQAAEHGRAEEVRRLLESGVNVNYRDGWSSTALMFASANGHLEIVEELLDAGAPINERSRMDRTPLMWAAHLGYNHVVVYLLEHGADPALVDRKGMTAADLALKANHLDVVSTLKDYAGPNRIIYSDSIPNRNTEKIDGVESE